ncbi:MAG TPA: C40 family peptidase [Thermomicrobiales bacterium]
MAGLPRRARHGLILVIVGVLAATMLAPVTALADTNLEVGGEAVVAYANGDNVRFREGPDYGAQVIDMVPEGTWVDVYYGPITADDGSIWYQVGIDGTRGYISADFLAVAVPDGSGDTVAANATVLDAEGSDSADGIAEGAVVGVATIAGTNGDGVRCRADASTGAAIITVLPEGTSVELTGDAVDGWQPVNCAGQGGFVSTDYVSYDGSGGSDGGSSDSSSDDLSAQSTADFGAASVTGTAIVVGTNGGGLRCRAKANTSADVIGVFEEGSEVQLRGDASGSWQPVFCDDGSAGYASTDYLSYDGSGGDSSSGDGGGSGGSGGSTGLATIGDTNGDGLRCRSGASFDSSVIVVLSEGSTVELRGDPKGDWQPVTCAGENGFVHSDYLVYDGGAGGDNTGSAGEDSGGDSTTGTAEVGDTQGGGLRCRAGASFDAEILTVLSEGSTVDLRGDANGDWQPVFCDGQKGFVHADYLVYGGGGNGGSSGGSSGGGGSNSSLSSGDVAEVSGTNGDGVRFRSGPSTGDSVISVLAEGTVVDVIDGSTGDWVAVSYNGSDGYIHMDYLVLSDGSSGGGSSSDGGSSDGGGGGGLSKGDHAVTTADLNLRYDASFTAGVAAVAPEGTVVKITGGADNGFYPVDWDGLKGFMSGDYLSATDEDLSQRGGSGAPGGDGGGVSGGGGGGGSATGEAIANYAMQYLGYPYVWATHGPSSFDCSGFTYWVVLNTLGIDIGTGLWTQVAAGSSVSQSNLQPGDLVFFQNTFEWGLSHVGIYIGNGQFIHAENESTGVVISSLSSSYYSSRWYGAVRLA